MKYVLHVENSPTIRIGVAGLFRRRFPDVELYQVGNVRAAISQIKALPPNTFDAAILDWSLTDGDASELFEFLPKARILILTKHELSVQGVVVIPKDERCLPRIEAELRK